MLIEIKKLTYKIGSKKLLNNVSFNVSKGDKYLILGQNGSGKSLLIDCILDNVNYDGSIVKNQLSKEKIGVLYDQFSTLPLLKVKEILKLIESIYSTPRNDNLINILNMRSLLNKYFIVLSKGERKKIGLYTALFIDSELLILDEPTDGLDPDTRDIFWNLVTMYRKSIIMTTHLWEEAKFFADKIIFLEEGKILNPAMSHNELIAQFPFVGKIVTNLIIEDSDLSKIDVDNQSFIYFNHKEEKEKIINRILEIGISGYSIFQIDMKDIYLNLRHKI